MKTASPTTLGSSDGKTTAREFSTADNVKVYCRVRPLNKTEKALGIQNNTKDLCVRIPEGGRSSSSIHCVTRAQTVGNSTVCETTEEHHFTFAEVFGPTCTQQYVYEEVGLPVVEDVMAGYNGTIFVYGQTGSGKTHTMFGSNTDAATSSANGTTSARCSRKKTERGGNSDATETEVSPRTPASMAKTPADLTPRELQREADIKQADKTESGDQESTAQTRRNSKPSSVLRRTVTAAADAHSGVGPRAVEGIFKAIAAANVHMEFEVRMLFVEVYMEQVKDLLRPISRTVASSSAALTAGSGQLAVREDVATSSFYVEGCEMPFVSSTAEVMQLVSAGLRHRATRATAMNETSSRSHCILSLIVKSHNRQTHESKVGKMFLVDLAGSEKVSKTKSDGMRLEEAKLINKSLTTLGLVIVSLTEHSTHVPYRDSIVTKILKDSLGGNSRTSLVVCCSPAGFNVSETLSTLRFGARAKNIENRAVVNREYTIEELRSMLDLARIEISRLVSRLQDRERNSVAGGASSSISRIGLPGSTARSSARTVGRKDRSPIITFVGTDGPLVSPKTPLTATSGGTASSSSRESKSRVGATATTGVTTTASSVYVDTASVFEEKARSVMEINRLKSELGELEDALHAAQETIGALQEQRDAQCELLDNYNEEVSMWEREYDTLRQHFYTQMRSTYKYRALTDTLRDEIQLLVKQMEGHMEPVRAARAALLDAGRDVSIEGKTNESAKTWTQREAETHDLMSGAPQNGSRDGEVHHEGECLARHGPCSAATTVGAGTSWYRDGHANESNLSWVPNAAAAGASNSFTAAPLAGSDVYSCTPFKQTFTARATSEEGVLTAAVAASLFLESPLEPARAGSVPAHSSGPNPASSIIDAAATQERATQLESQMQTLTNQNDCLRQQFSAAIVELQLSEKKLGLRQSRLENMKLALAQETRATEELRQMLEREREAQGQLLAKTRDDTDYWRNRYEGLREQVLCASEAGRGLSALRLSSVSRLKDESEGEYGNDTLPSPMNIYKRLHGGAMNVVECGPTDEVPAER